ncbi:MAG TPA: PKD domain-containing protein, partial [Gammaproteobacteria bacterium]|nr:PKD domain-containing protein [Gammaproteobacteria bacterium]
TATPTTGKAPLNVAFDAGASSDTEGPITQYRWKFNDGSPLAFGKKVNHLFQLPGSYTVALSVEDNAGQTTTATRGIVASKTTPTNTAPQAAYSFTPTSGNAPLKVSFDASSSTDAEGAIKSYQWQFENGETATGKTASHTFTQAGDYPVKLTVTDGGNLTSSITHIVKATPATTTNQPPKAVMTASPASGTAPLTVQFTGTQSTDSDGQITGYTWSFGDGAS